MRCVWRSRAWSGADDQRGCEIARDGTFILTSPSCSAAGTSLLPDQTLASDCVSAVSLWSGEEHFSVSFFILKRAEPPKSS